MLSKRKLKLLVHFNNFDRNCLLELLWLTIIITLTLIIGLSVNKFNLKQNYYFKTDKQFMNYLDKYFNSTKSAQESLLKWFETKSNRTFQNEYLFFKNNYKTNDVLCVGLITKERFSEQNYDYATQTLMSLVTRIQQKHQNKVSITLFNVSNSPFQLNNLFKVININTTNDYSNTKIKEALDYSNIMRIISKRHECKYGLLVEDDSIAAPNWYLKLIETIDLLEAQYSNKWMCLKLFTSFRYYDWLIHFETIFKSILFVIIFASAEYFIIFNINKHFKFNFKLKKFAYAISLNLIVLKFYLNSSHISPLGYGVKKYSQGFNTVAILYPKDQLDLIAAYLDSSTKQHLIYGKEFLPKDIALNEYKKQNSLNEFILEPALFQHIGVHSSLRRDIFNSQRNVLNYQFGPFHSYSFLKEYSQLIKFDVKFWLN